jgi:hypothetical protein
MLQSKRNAHQLMAAGFTARGQSACMYDAKLIEYLKRDWKPDSRRM